MNNRTASVLGFSFLFAYILTLLFGEYVPAVVAAHFAGLFSCGFFVKNARHAKRVVFIGMGLCFFPSIIVASFASGCAVAAWGYFLKAFTPKGERIKTCADVIIYSNILMIIFNLIGTAYAIACVPVGMFFVYKLPCGDEEICLPGDIKKPLRILFVFIAIITVNAGLMYSVINPAFAHLAELAAWFWAVPYIVAIAIVRFLLVGEKRTAFLFVGVAMMAGAFIGFMLLGRGSFGYIVVDTLMLGAFGIFDLFWWSVLGEMLDYTDNPAKVFGIGLSANVFGILCGGFIGAAITANGLSGAEVAVTALVVVCVTVALLPLLKRVTELQSDDVVSETDETSEPESEIKLLNTLTGRESEVLKLVLEGKSNLAIAQVLAIKEGTVKTYVHSIFSKYGVDSRAELMSKLLK